MGNGPVLMCATELEVRVGPGGVGGGSHAFLASFSLNETWRQTSPRYDESALFVSAGLTKRWWSSRLLPGNAAEAL